MKSALAELLSSKKNLLALFTILAALGAKVGLGFSPAEAVGLVSPLIAAIVGLGMADMGKSKAQAEALVTHNAAVDSAMRFAAIHAHPDTIQAVLEGPAPIAPPATTGVKIGSSIAAIALLVITSIGIGAHGCATAKKIEAGAGSAAQAWLECEGQDLIKGVDETGKPLISVVANDLIAGNYADAIAALIGKVGKDAVGCAVLAVDSVVSAGKTSGAAALTPIEAHAKEMIGKYGWQRKSAAVTTPGPAGSRPSTATPAPAPAP